MYHNNKGLSLVEMLISVVISAIILAAAYSSYTVISNNFNIQKDLKFMSQSARSVVEMIARDVRMGGYKDFNNADIGTPIKITDSSNNCCDRIDIIYDKSKSTRVKISYYTKVYKNRNRLMKQVSKCNTPDCSSTSIIQAEQPIADYVEDLQFSGFKDGSVASTGAVEYGMGNKKWFYPVRAELSAYHGSANNRCKSSMSSIAKAFDGDPNTIWQCPKGGRAAIMLYFKDYVRITKVKLHTAYHLDGGTFNKYGSGGGADWPDSRNTTYPFAKNHNLDGRYTFVHWDKTTNSSGTDPKSHKCLHKDPTKRKWTRDDRTGCSLGGSNFSSLHLSAKEAIFSSEPPNNRIEKCQGASATIDGHCYVGSSSDRQFSYIGTNQIVMKLDQAQTCYGFKQSSSNKCNPRNTFLLEVPDVAFYGEVYGEPVVPSEVDIGLLLRSPNEHGSTNRSFSINLGNRAYSSNDLYLRDNYSTTVVARNVYYK